MRTLFVIAAMFAATSAKAGDCSRYIHETDPNMWISEKAGAFVWHKPNDGDYIFKIGVNSGEEELVHSAYSGPEDSSGATDTSFAAYRFANVNGKATLIWEGEFYFRDCDAIAAK